MGRQKDRSVDRHVGRYVDKRVDRHVDGYLDRQVDRYVDRHVNKYVARHVLAVYRYVASVYNKYIYIDIARIEVRVDSLIVATSSQIQWFILAYHDLRQDVGSPSPIFRHSPYPLFVG